MSDNQYFKHLEDVSFATNQGFSPGVQLKIKEEGERVYREILSPRNLPTRRILIIGGAGYIGIPVSSFLLERGYKVRCLDLDLYNTRGCVTDLLGREDYEFIHGDHSKSSIIDNALEDVTDVIILAGLVGDPITKAYPNEHQIINQDGLKNLIKNLNNRGLNKVLFISTCSNYGEIVENKMADENFKLKPLSLYSKAKVAREKQLLSLRDKVDYSGTILRFATAFGLSGRMRFDLTVSEFTRELYKGNNLEVYDADTWRPYCHVIDFARGLTRVLEMPVSDVYFNVFNAGGDINNFTKKMIVDAVRDKIKTGKVSYVDGGLDRRNYRVNFTKIRETLFFEPLYSVTDGINELIKAMDQGFFDDYQQNLNFYRNKEIYYSFD